MSDMRVYSGQETPSADIEMQDIKMEAEIIVEPHVPNALRRALEYAGDDGFVASMPQRNSCTPR